MVPSVVPVRVRSPPLSDLRDAEVEQLGLALGRHHDVARLHIAVDDAGLMRAGQPARNLQGDADRLGRRQRATLEALLERLAVAIGHRDERPCRRSFPRCRESCRR